MKNKKIIIFVVCLALAIVLFVLLNKKTVLENLTAQISHSFSNSEETIVEAWKVGSEATATLYEDGNLVISGTGKMKNSLSSSFWDGHEAYKERIRSIVIKEGIVDICAYAFKECTNLVTIEIPNTVATIWQNAFEDCTSLKSITIPSECVEIGRNLIETDGVVNINEREVFSGCESLESINVNSENVEYSSIDGVLFNKNKTVLKYYPLGKKDEQYSIPTGVKTVVSINCNNLKKIYIPSTVTNLNESITIAGKSWYFGPVFELCDNLESINVSPENTEYSSTDGVLFNKEKTTILRYPSGKKDITKYSIPGNVTEIGYCAFGKCNNLTNIEIPKGVVVGMYAFINCTKLESIEILEDTMVGQGAFSFCTDLNSIEIAEGAVLGYSAFRGCTGLKNIKMPENAEIYENIFKEAQLTVDIKETKSQEIMLEILSRALDENDILYAEEKFELVNCEWNENRTLKMNGATASIKVGAGTLSELTIMLNTTKAKKMEIKEPPAKTNYNSHENFETTGMKLEIVFENDEREETTDYKIVNGNNLTCQVGSVEIQYNQNSEIKAEIEINVEHDIQKATCTEKGKCRIEGCEYQENVLGHSFTNYISNNDATCTKEGTETAICDRCNEKNTVTVANSKIPHQYQNGVCTMCQEKMIQLEIASNKYTIQEAYIIKISGETTLEVFKQNLETNAEVLTILNQDNVELTANEIIGTGMTCIFKLGEEIKNFKLVVSGDTTGDGKVDFKDIVSINRHRLNKKILEGEYLIAGEVTGDDIVDFKDIVKINRFRLNKIAQLF